MMAGVQIFILNYYRYFPINNIYFPASKPRLILNNSVEAACERFSLFIATFAIDSYSTQINYIVVKYLFYLRMKF